MTNSEINNLINVRKAAYKNLKEAIKNGDSLNVTKYRKQYLQLGKQIKAVKEEGIEEDKIQVEVELVKPLATYLNEMKYYLAMVTKTIQPGLIVCGAPGIGKTFNVLQFLKRNAYMNKVNMGIIKGACTAVELYTELYKMRNKGEILLIDDADTLIGPKAPEDTLSLLKAALDSTSMGPGKLVTYKSSRKIVSGSKDDEYNIPQEFYYNGSIIILTNYNIGQIDTALKGRVFTQNIKTNNVEILKYLKTLMKDIEPDSLSLLSKIKAYDYLMDIAKQNVDMEISIRSFITCAKIYELQITMPEIPDEQINQMIKEQVVNQALRGGRKF
jgi:hypothetical protein